MFQGESRVLKIGRKSLLPVLLDPIKIQNRSKLAEITVLDSNLLKNYFKPVFRTLGERCRARENDLLGELKLPDV